MGNPQLVQGEASSQRKWLLPLAALLVPVLLSAMATLIVQNLNESHAHEQLELQGEVVSASIRAGFDAVTERVKALRGLFEASQEVTGDEYTRFVNDIGIAPGMGGLAYIAIVQADELATFERQMAPVIPGYRVFELDADGGRVPVGPRETYYPVQYFEPAEAFGQPVGLDAGSPPGRLPYILAAVGHGATVATPLVSLAPTGQEGIVLYVPVRDDLGAVVGLVVTPIVIFELMTQQIPARLADGVEWAARDITGGAVSLPGVRNESYFETVAVADRSWEIEVTLSEGSPGSPATPPYWIVVAGLVVGILAAIGTFSFNRKTEALERVAALTDSLMTKDHFIATMSHELRTPLTGVLGFAEILHDPSSELTGQEKAELAATIAKEASDLANIIDDLLVMNRAEYGTLTTVAVPVDLRAQTAQVLEAMELLDDVRIQAMDPDQRAIGDPARVRQIIRNLLNNARHYGGTTIQVRIERAGDQVALAVIDDGGGVPAGHEDKVFEPYHRAHTTTGRTASMGLGLSVSRALARKMEGDLSYRRSSGQTQFVLTLMASASALPKHEPRRTPVSV